MRHCLDLKQKTDGKDITSSHRFFIDRLFSFHRIRAADELNIPVGIVADAGEAVAALCGFNGGVYSVDKSGKIAVNCVLSDNRAPSCSR